MCALLVLIVDDEPDILDMAQLLLELAGYETAAAASGALALEFLASHHPAAVVLDVNMPGLSGIEVARLMRQDAANDDMAVLFHTALDKDLLRSHLLDVDGHIHKPSQSVDIANHVDRAVQQRNA